MIEGQGWTPQQYSVIVQAILSSPYQAVLVSKARASIGNAALEALVQANLLSYRPPSSRGPSFLLMSCFCILQMIMQNTTISSFLGRLHRVLACMICCKVKSIPERTLFCEGSMLKVPFTWQYCHLCVLPATEYKFGGMHV